MLQTHFEGSAYLWLPLIALVFFFLFFVAVLVRVTFGLRDPREVERLAALPFAGDPTSDRAAPGREEPRHG